MKKMKKLTSLLMAFAMTASLAAIPANAATVNIFPDPGFEAEGTNLIGGWKRLNTNVVVTKTDEKAHTGKYSVFADVDETKPLAGCVGIEYSFAPGKYYYMSAYILPKEPQTQLNYGTASTNKNTLSERYQKTAPGSSQTEKMEYYKELEALFEAELAELSEEEAAALKKTYTKNTYAVMRMGINYNLHTMSGVNMNTTEWTKVKSIYDTTSLTADSKSNIYIQSNSDNACAPYDFYSDDYFLCEIDLTKKEDVPVWGILEVTAPSDLDMKNVTLANGTVKKVWFDEEAQLWKIKYEGATPYADNALTFKSAFGTKEFTLNFKTGKQTPQPLSENILEGTNIDYSFESATGQYKGIVESGAAETITIVDAASEGITAVDGKNVLKIEGGANDNEIRMNRFNSIPNILDLTKTFEVSCWVRSATESTQKLRLIISNAGASILAPKEAGRVDVVPTTEWQRVSVRFTVADQSATFPDAKGNYFHIVTTREKGDDSVIYVDNYAVREIVPEMTVTTAGIENGAVDVDKDSVEISYTFSANPYEDLTAANFKVTPAADVAVEKTDALNYTIKLSGLDFKTQYTVETVDVQDKYAQYANSSITFTTASSAPVSSDISEPIKFVSSNTNSVDNATVTTDADGIVTATKKEGQTYAVAQANLIPFELGSKYMVSAWVRNNDAEPAEAATANISISLAGASKHYYVPKLWMNVKEKINDNEWHKLVNMIDMTPTSCDLSGKCTEEKCVSAGRGAHSGVQTSKENKSFSIKDFQVRKLMPLDLNNKYFATVVNEGENAALYITGEESTVFFAAATYEGENVADIEFGKADVTEATIAEIDITAGDNYKVFIWDSNLAPICTTFTGADF